MYRVHCIVQQPSSLEANSLETIDPQITNSDTQELCVICMESCDTRITSCMYNCKANVHEDCLREWYNCSGSVCVICRQKEPQIYATARYNERQLMYSRNSVSYMLTTNYETTVLCILVGCYLLWYIFILCQLS